MERTVSCSLTKFAVKFCNELGTSKTSVCSPLSAETVLALLALGCRGQARAELLQALDMADDDAIRSSFAFLTSTLKGIEGTTISMANRVYLNKGVTLKPAIKKDAEEVFGSGLEQLDFNEREAAAGVINQWVAQQTNNLIKDMVTADNFNEETCMLLINAIYFKGKWETPFEERLTKNREFYVNKETIIKVPQMYMSQIRHDYGCSKKLKAKLLRIPYQGREASMVIILPDEKDGLNRMMQQLAEGYNLMAAIEKMRKTKLDVRIPKFKVEMTINLKEVLPKLGIKTIFDKENSDVEMVASNKRMFVSEAVQKAFIEVDEVGTEAAACTVMDIVDCCADFVSIPRFFADRPFLYLLTAGYIPLFIGIYEGKEYASNEPERKLCLDKTVEEEILISLFRERDLK